MLRWEMLVLPFGLGKVMVHYFPPNVSDRDPHDHPSPFITLILAGGYFNTEWVPVDLDDQEYMPEVEWLGRGALRYRGAKHTHITETGDRAAWTLVFMGPKTRRRWGFLRVVDGTMSWWPWKKYVKEYGGVVRCDTGELDQRKEGQYAPYKLYGGSE